MLLIFYVNQYTSSRSKKYAHAAPRYGCELDGDQSEWRWSGISFQQTKKLSLSLRPKYRTIQLSLCVFALLPPQACRSRIVQGHTRHFIPPPKTSSGFTESFINLEGGYRKRENKAIRVIQSNSRSDRWWHRCIGHFFLF